MCRWYMVTPLSYSCTMTLYGSRSWFNTILDTRYTLRNWLAPYTMTEAWCSLGNALDVICPENVNRISRKDLPKRTCHSFVDRNLHERWTHSFGNYTLILSNSYTFLYHMHHDTVQISMFVRRLLRHQFARDLSNARGTFQLNDHIWLRNQD
jgi:hypothetical protein